MKHLLEFEEKFSRVVGVRLAEKEYRALEKLSQEKNRKTATISRALILYALKKLKRL